MMRSRGPATDAHGSLPLEILIVINTTARRGAEIQGAELARELNERGVPCGLLALTSTDQPSTGVRALGRRRFGWTTLRSLRRAAQGADVVIAYGSSTLPACATALVGTRTPFIYRSIGDPGDWVRGEVHRFRTGLLFRRASHVVALWPGAADEIVRLYSVPPRHVSVIPNARDHRRFAPPTVAERDVARRTFGVVAEGAVIVMLGALSPEKQVGHAVAAMELVPEATLLIAGDGPDRSAIEAMVDVAEVPNVRLVGTVENPVQILHAADAVLLSSRTEGTPGVIIEAGMSAVPTVAPNVGSVSELVVHDVTGVIVESTDPASIAAGLRRALAEAGEMGQAARHHMLLHYTWDVAATRWIEVISRVANRSRPDLHSVRDNN